MVDEPAGPVTARGRRSRWRGAGFMHCDEQAARGRAAYRAVDRRAGRRRGAGRRSARHATGIGYMQASTARPAAPDGIARTPLSMEGPQVDEQLNFLPLRARGRQSASDGAACSARGVGGALIPRRRPPATLTARARPRRWSRALLACLLDIEEGGASGEARASSSRYCSRTRSSMSSPWVFMRRGGC